MQYIGKGDALIGVPARDLTEEEVKKHGKKLLIKSGLYKIEEKPEEPKEGEEGEEKSEEKSEEKGESGKAAGEKE